MDYLQVKNLDHYQHYKDRDPKWIKLYYSILDDEIFMILTEVERCRYMTCLIIASRTENKIPYDSIYLKKVMRLDKSPDLSRLISLGFLIRCDESRQSLDIDKHLSQATNQPLLSSPLLNSLNSSESVSDLKSKSCSKKRNNGHGEGWPIPEDWLPNESHKKLAQVRGLDLPIEAAHFRGKAGELAWTTTRWDQKFTNWMLQEIKFRQRRAR